MTTTNTHTANSNQPVEKVYEAPTDAGFWEKVASRFSAADGKVEEFDTTDAGITAVIRQIVFADKIPAQTQEFVRSGVGMTCTFVISPLNDDGTTSTVITEASGVPASFSASQKLTVQGEGSALTANFEFTTNVLLLGDKFKEKAAPYLERVPNAETAVLADYVAK